MHVLGKRVLSADNPSDVIVRPRRLTEANSNAPLLSQEIIMTVIEEFKVRNAAGNTVILQHIGKGISYLDFGMTHLPRNFQGYRVKYTDRTAQAQNDGSFKLTDSNDTYTKV
jgi:hypothetical protein